MLIKKLLSVLIFIFLYLISTGFTAFGVELSAKSAVIINSETNEIIYEKNKDQRLSMASTTKIMTSLLAIESGRLHCVVTAKKDIICDGTAISIKKGDSFTLETLVYAMLLESGNDAAILTAEYLAGSEQNFAVMMNNKAKEIGMASTNFVTSSGLDSEEHYSTAYDMALLGSYAIKNPVFKKICSTEKYMAEYINPKISEAYYNHNKLLNFYSGVVGIKTGFTKKSGRCLVSACEQDGVCLVAVTLNASDDWNDHIKMYDNGFSELNNHNVEICIPQYVKVYGADKKQLKINIDKLCLPTDGISYKLHLKKWYYAPISAGDILGYAKIYLNNKLIDTVPIYSEESVICANTDNKPDFSFIYKLKQIFS